MKAKPADNTTYIELDHSNVNIVLQFVYPFLYIALRYETSEAAQRSPFGDSFVDTLSDAVYSISKSPHELDGFSLVYFVHQLHGPLTFKPGRAIA